MSTLVDGRGCGSEGSGYSWGIAVSLGGNGPPVNGFPGVLSDYIARIGKQRIPEQLSETEHDRAHPENFG